MLKVEDITSEQLDLVILDLDKEFLVNKCVALQGLIYPDAPEKSPYAVPENIVANEYCFAKKDLMEHPEHSVEWYTEWEVLHKKVVSVCEQINAILAIEPATE